MNIYIALQGHTEYCGFSVYLGIVTNVEDYINEKYRDYPQNSIAKHETEEGIYVGVIEDDDETITSFNNDIANKDYESAYYYSTYDSVFLKKESIN